VNIDVCMRVRARVCVVVCAGECGWEGCARVWVWVCRCVGGARVDVGGCGWVVCACAYVQTSIYLYRSRDTAEMCANPTLVVLGVRSSCVRRSAFRGACAQACLDKPFGLTL